MGQGFPSVRLGDQVSGRMADQYLPEPGERSFTCSECGVEQHYLSEFPKGRCIDCHDRATRGQVITAEELRKAFGIR